MLKNRTTTVLVAVLLLLLGGETAWSKKEKKKPSGDFYLSATVGGYPGNAPQGAKGETFYGLKLGYDIPGIGIVDSLGIEGFAAQTQTEDKATKVYQFRVDTIHPLTVNKKLTPFLALGGGWVHAGDDSMAEDGVIVSLGFGAKYALTNYLMLRADFRDMIWFEPGQDNYLETSVGISYLFGQERIKKPQPLPDADRDGVADTQDKCPETPRGIAVDAQGCPTDTKDGDRDTVPDYRDRCPATPTGTPVNLEGCPKDSDGDNIPDFRDRCPGTPLGMDVDENGCVRLIGPLTSSIPEVFDAKPQPIALEKKIARVEDILPKESSAAQLVIPADSQEQTTLDLLPAVVPAAPLVEMPVVAEADEAVEDSTRTAVAIPVSGQIDLPEIAPSTPVFDAGERAVPTQFEVGVAAVDEPLQVQPQPADLPLIGTDSAAPGASDEIQAQKENIALPDIIRVEFDFDRAKVQESFRGRLVDVAERLKRSPTLRLRVEGHTDSLGSHAYNDSLSQKRAESVKRDLQDLGGDPERITAVGYGERRPIAENDTESGRQKNRRALIVFLKKQD